MNERWLPVPGVDGYDVSDRGSVRSWWVRGSNPRRMSSEPTVLAPATQRGYKSVSLVGHRRRRVHALVLEAFVGPCPDGMETRHLNGNRGDNRWPENLAWGTKLENAADRDAHGTTPRGDAHYSRTRPEVVARGDRHGMRLNPGSVRRGSANGHSKQTEGNVRVIDMLLGLADGERPSMDAIAAPFRISMHSVFDIKRGRTWRHITGRSWP